MYLVYKTDTWHSYDSRDLIGVCSTKRHVQNVITAQIEKEGGEPLSEDQIFNLNNISQTQGYGGEGEFVVEEVEINTLI